MSRSISVEGQKVFDYKTVHQCPKTGKILRRTDYVMTIDTNGTRFESPPKSGMIYNSKGELIHDGQKNHSIMLLPPSIKSRFEMINKPLGAI